MHDIETDAIGKHINAESVQSATLREEAVKSGYVTEEEFDRFVRPEAMV